MLQTVLHDCGAYYRSHGTTEVHKATQEKHCYRACYVFISVGKRDGPPQRASVQSEQMQPLQGCTLFPHCWVLKTEAGRNECSARGTGENASASNASANATVAAPAMCACMHLCFLTCCILALFYPIYISTRLCCPLVEERSSARS